MKRFLIVCAALLTFTASAFAYSVGDLLMVNGETGVVFAISADGQHGKVVSVAETKCIWSYAKTWCSEYGNGWRLPRQEELKMINSVRDVINSTLSANGYSVLYNAPYWSIDELDSKNAWYVQMPDGYTNVTEKELGTCRVRAVCNF